MTCLFNALNMHLVCPVATPSQGKHSDFYANGIRGRSSLSYAFTPLQAFTLLRDLRRDLYDPDGLHYVRILEFNWQDVPVLVSVVLLARVFIEII